jgi:hypothetical protein
MAGQVAAPFVGFDQHFVGDDVELFLDFALHVLALGAAQHAAQRAFVDGVADALAGARHHFQQQAQLPGDEAVHALLFDQVAGEADFVCHENSPYSASARVTTSRTSLLRSGRRPRGRWPRGRAAPGFGQLLPAVQGARQAGSHLRVDGVELDHAVAPEHIACRVRRWKAPGLALQ